MKFSWFVSSFLGLFVLQTVAAIAQPNNPLPSRFPTPQLPPANTVPPPQRIAPPPSPVQPIAPVPAPVQTPALPNLQGQRPIVVIDPGHGGPDPGAVGIGGIYEKDIAMDISLQVARLLQTLGAQVILTREVDMDLGLQPRVDIANRANASIFVSIHANAISMDRPDVNGIETYHIAGSQRGRELATSIQQQLLEKTGMRDRGVKRARFHVLVHTKMPAVLVEVGFVTGQEDVVRLSDPATRTIMAQAIVQGIVNYLQSTNLP